MTSVRGATPAPNGHAMVVGRVQGDLARTVLGAFAAARDSDALLLAADLAELDFAPFDILGSDAQRRLRLVDTAAAYDAFHTADPQRLLADWDGVLDAALDSGFTGLRVVADNTPMLTGSPESTARWHTWEQTTDAWQARRPVAGTCFFDARRVPAEALARVSRLHPALAGTPAPSWRLVHRTVGGGLRVELSGELEAWDHDELLTALTNEIGLIDATVDPEVTVELDLHGLTYLHHAPARTLRALPPLTGRRVRVLGASTTVRRLLVLLPELADLHLD